MFWNLLAFLFLLALVAEVFGQTAAVWLAIGFFTWWLVMMGMRMSARHRERMTGVRRHAR